MLPALLAPLLAVSIAALPVLPAGSAAGSAAGDRAPGSPALTGSVEVAPGSTTRTGVFALARAAAAVGVAAAAGAVPSSRSPARPRGQWMWPLRPQPAVVRGFEPPAQRWAGGHRGVDLAGGTGQAVRAAGDGVVGYSGVIAGRGVVTIRHAGGWRTTYEPVDDRLPEGTVVAAGEPIGQLAGGPANHCAPRVCLHWGAITGVADYRDPLVLLGLGHPVLLPLQPA